MKPQSIRTTADRPLHLVPISKGPNHVALRSPHLHTLHLPWIPEHVLRCFKPLFGGSSWGVGCLFDPNSGAPKNLETELGDEFVLQDDLHDSASS